ncbi:MAG: D-2-hydroxyacid dehydrogenase [Phycisphaeraceae bacterium]|nr:D-2-hydroxyacid dehydrogenase [Phycisphaeraceae bacterium]
MKIVCLDGYTLNPGDISWSPFEALGSFVTYDRTSADQIVTRAQGAQILLTNKTMLSARTLTQLPQAKYIGVLATGYNVVDVKAAAVQGIVVTNVPAYGTDSVAQHAAALLLELARRVGLHHQAVAAGQWTKSPDFCFAVAPVIELTGRTLGIVGFGRIGLALARIASAMGMILLAHHPRPLEPSRLGGLNVTQVDDVDDLFAQSDVISLHCPLTEQTKHLVNARRLAMMKPTAFLLNTGRGPLVDQDALAKALHEGRLAGAGLDVLDVEPPASNNPLLAAPNCIITPHLAWYAQEARQRLMRIAAENLHAFLAGKPVNVVR